MNRRLYRRFLDPLRIAFVSLALILGCQSDDASTESKMPTKDIRTVMDDHVDELMAIDGVVGVYLGELTEGIMCIKVMVVKKTTDIEKKIPQTLEGHAVVIDETGEIRGLDDS